MSDRLSDAEKNQSTQMNATKSEAAIENEGGVRIVFIGNSITLHPILPSIAVLVLFVFLLIYNNIFY